METKMGGKPPTGAGKERGSGSGTFCEPGKNEKFDGGVFENHLFLLYYMLFFLLLLPHQGVATLQLIRYL